MFNGLMVQIYRKWEYFTPPIVKYCYCGERVGFPIIIVNFAY